MASQLEVLFALAPCDRAQTIDDISKLLSVVAGDRAERKLVVKALGRLIANGFVAHTQEAKGTKGRAVFPAPKLKDFYAATDEGREFLGSELKRKPGRTRNGVHRSRAKRETLRSRVWAALRMKGKASVPDLLEVARRPEDDPKKSLANVQKYLWSLSAAGIVKALPVKQQGFAPSSPGFKRYVILRDLGAKAPLVGRKFVFDPNVNERIAYAAMKAAA
ncbi:MAG: hypothetical protein WCA78_00525 [Rhizomicrobium sp.]